LRARKSKEKKKEKKKEEANGKRLGFSKDVLVDTEMDDDKSRNVGTRQRWIRARIGRWPGSCQPLAVVDIHSFLFLARQFHWNFYEGISMSGLD
jgi:hypothetical protein